MSLLDLFKSGDDVAKAKLTQDLDELFKPAEEDRRAFEPQWLTNLAFYHSKQWFEWDDGLRKLKDLREEMPWWRPSMVVNLIKPSVITQYAKILAHKPTATVEPVRATPDAKQSARFCDRYLEWQWPRMRKDQLSKRAVLWADITGTALGKIYWEPFTGDVLTDPETGRPRTLKDGRPLRKGDACAIAVAPFEFYPEPNAESIEEMGWVFHVKLRSKGYVKEKFGVEVDDDSVKADTLAGARLMEMLDPKGQRQTRGVVVKEFWERPTAANPEGRYVVYAGDKILRAGPNPYPKLPIPFVSMTFHPAPGQFWGACTVDDLIDLQRNYNKARSQAIEQRNLLSKGQWLIPDGTLDEEYEITSAPGQQITYRPGPNGEKPEMVRGLEVPATFFQDMAQTRQEVYEVSGQHEVSQGQSPYTKTATGIALLQEQDDTRLGPTIQSYEAFVQKMEEATLILTKQHYAEPRLMAVSGKDGSVEVLHFTAANIPDDIKVRVQPGSSLPRSRTARQEYVRGLVKDGLIKDTRVALKMLELGDIEGLYDDLNADIQQAERENRRMKGDPDKELAPEPVLVEDFHNHALHVNEHNRYRKSEEYEAQPDDVKALFEKHVADHNVFLMTMPPAPGEVVPGIPEPTVPEPDLAATAGVPDLLAAEPEPDLFAIQ